MPVISVNIKRLDNNVELPRYAYPGDAGLDLRASKAVDIKPFQRFSSPPASQLPFPMVTRALYSHVPAWRLSKA